MQMVRSPAKTGRSSGLIGVCAALGEEFGFNPDYLRVALAATLLWSPLAVLSGYAAAGLLVLLSRWLVPDDRRTKKASSIIAEDATSQVGHVMTNDEDTPRMAA